jgi:transposase
MFMMVVFHHGLEDLKRWQRQEKDALRSRNLQIVILALQGWTAPAIAMASGLSRRMVQRRVQAYNQRGLAGLEESRGAPATPLLNPQEETVFRARVEAGARPADEVCSLRGRDFRRILREEFGKHRSLSSVYAWLHRWGYSYLRPRPRHQKADLRQQQAFIQELPEKLRQIAALHPTKKLRVYFQDEARFGQQGTTTNVWAPRGSRPTVVRQTAYQYLWVLAAVCPETGFSEGLISPRLNTECVNLFLEELSRRLPEDEHAVMLWDGAGFHSSHQLRIPENITPITLPSYSPELNPIENLWHYLKSHHWSNRAYDDTDELEQAVIQAWHKSVMDTELMKTVCSDNIYHRATIT